MNFQSYQTMPEEARIEPVHQYNPARVVGGTVSVSVQDGVHTEVIRGNESGSTAELNPYYGTDSILASAVHPKGLPVHRIEDDTLIMVNGLQATASFWAKEGLLTKGADGTYTEATEAPQAAPAEVNADVVPLHPDHAAVLQEALGDMPETQAMAIAAAGIGAATGRLDPQALASKFGDVTGLRGEEAAQRLQAMQAVFQAQADGTLVHKFGVGKEDLEAFYAYCRTSKRDAMQDALGRQIHANDMGGWRALATQWLSQTAPSVDALRQAGIPVRKSSHRVGAMEAYVKGSWADVRALSRAGLV